MAQANAETDAAAIAESHDESGVDRTQIREMLALTPVERLRRLEGFVESTLVIRALNDRTAIR